MELQRKLPFVPGLRLRRFYTVTWPHVHIQHPHVILGFLCLLLLLGLLLASPAALRAGPAYLSFDQIPSQSTGIDQTPILQNGSIPVNAGPLENLPLDAP